MANLFLFNNYKDFLNAQVEENQKVYGYKSQLAGAAHCQKSFLSAILSRESSTHFTPDHACGLAEFWNFTPREKDYFLTLVDRARAGTPELQTHLESRLARIKEKNEKLAARFEQKELAAKWQPTFYSSWYYGAIHILVTIPQYQTSEAISKRMGLPVSIIKQILQQLSEMKLIKYEESRWKIAENSVHLPNDSPLNLMNHSTWRQRALTDVIEQNPSGIHYSAVYSLSHQDIEKLRQKILEFLEETRQLVIPSKEEDLIGLCLDFFRV